MARGEQDSNLRELILEISILAAEPLTTPLKIVFQLSTSKSKPRTRRGLVVPK
jgi:hypothetical protein